MRKWKRKGDYLVIFINHGEHCEAYHHGKTIDKIKKQYKLEKLEIVSITDLG